MMVPQLSECCSDRDEGSSNAKAESLQAFASSLLIASVNDLTVYTQVSITIRQ